MVIAFCSPIISNKAAFLGVGCTGLLIEDLSDLLEDITSLVAEDDVTKLVYVVSILR